MKTLIQILFIVFAIAIIGCSEKEENTANADELIATWTEKTVIESSNKYSVVEYVFDENGDYELVRKVYNAKTDEFLGYRYQEIGKFVLIDNQLTFHIQETYVNDDAKGLFSDIENLVLVENSSENEFTLTVKFEDNMNTLIYIYPPCPPNANCIDKSVFIKNM